MLALQQANALIAAAASLVGDARAPAQHTKLLLAAVDFLEMAYTNLDTVLDEMQRVEPQ
jgi:hypothetical protein